MLVSKSTFEEEVSEKTTPICQGCFVNPQKCEFLAMMETRSEGWRMADMLFR